VAWYTRALTSAPQIADLEDVRSQAIVGLLEAIRAFDGDTQTRLAAIAPQYIVDAVAQAASPVAAFSVPKRTLTRFFGILRAADGNVYDAARLAPEYEMKTETFLAVLSAVRDVDSYDALTEAREEDGGQSGDVATSPIWDGRQADAEDRVLVEAAFRSVDTLEKDVTRLAYGFTEYDPVPDAEIGARLGLSRQKTQRTRSSALGKMREALGVA
jgi:DNA-directed RNA polymerase specialized sigma subunit